ncbi:uncharacterized protein LOC111627187 [Centruroides sculpturatus]|uniref:uncharacterized protein LOC111627187 n=1 Tax=Centruroides sculpturatus TaxID=218467 RepID=UPI000C6CA290|nr:uncharacterized protein LOC111627187 [Centruroides sculpturatus]
MKVEAVKTWEDLKKLKHAFYGPTGPVAKLKQKLKNASPVEKPTLGKKLQKLVADQEKKFAAIVKNLTQQAIDERIKTESVDIGSPTAPLGSLHPLTLVANRARQWLLAQGYFETVGSAVESDEFNFERLSIPADHPSREMHDTLYLDKSNLLRTHNTSLSAREMALRPNQSFAQFSIGSVYRNDVDDATHSHQFLQLDLVNVGPYGLPELI